MTHTNFRLEAGTALLITGPQGSGKTRLARAIAAKHGTFAEIDASVLSSTLMPGSVLHARPRTLIVDEFRMADVVDRAALKLLITNDGTVTAHRQHRPPTAVRAPHFIFCSSDRDALSDEGNRRFYVIELGRP